jgi:signal transduction histidine kinase
VRDLVHAHGGTIQARSLRGRGTEVRFTLPVAARGTHGDRRG